MLGSVYVTFRTTQNQPVPLEGGMVTPGGGTVGGAQGARQALCSPPWGGGPACALGEESPASEPRSVHSSLACETLIQLFFFF